MSLYAKSIISWDSPFKRNYPYLQLHELIIQLISILLEILPFLQEILPLLQSQRHCNRGKRRKVRNQCQQSDQHFHHGHKILAETLGQLSGSHKSGHAASLAEIQAWYSHFCFFNVIKKKYNKLWWVDVAEVPQWCDLKLSNGNGCIKIIILKENLTIWGRREK